MLLHYLFNYVFRKLDINDKMLCEMVSNIRTFNRHLIFLLFGEKKLENFVSGLLNSLVLSDTIFQILEKT